MSDQVVLAGEQESYGVPETLLRYDGVVTSGINSTNKLSTVSPFVQQQKTVLSDTPIVTTTDKILDCILPAREVPYDDGSFALQAVSHTQVSRQDLSDLKDTFEYKLADAKARPSGICPVRQAIHAMLFDEMLRQVAIDCPERGLLLLRNRDELRMTLDAYSALYDASVAYSSRKMHEATKNVPEMTERIKDLTEDTAVLTRELRRLEAKHAAMVRCAEERQAADLKKNSEEKLFMERTKQRLQTHLDSVKEAQDAERRAMRTDLDDGHEGQ
jgi:dynein light intermediate chain